MKNKKKLFTSSGVIGGWNLDTNAVYTGTKHTSNGFSTTGITLCSDGSIHSPRFHVNADGTVGIRSGTATGKRIVIDSVNNRIDLYNSNGYNVIRIDESLNTDWDSPVIFLKSPTGVDPTCFLANNAIEIYKDSTHYFKTSVKNTDLSIQFKGIPREDPANNNNLRYVYWDQSTGTLKAHP